MNRIMHEGANDFDLVATRPPFLPIPQTDASCIMHHDSRLTNALEASH